MSMPVVDAHAGEHEGEVFARGVAARAGRVRAAADAGEGGVEAGDAGLERGVDVGEGEAAGVVEVAAPEAVAGDPARFFEQLAHRGRAGVADGVGDADAVGAGIEQALHAAQHLALRDLALDRAAEGGADAAFKQRLRAGGVAGGADPAELGDHFVGRLAQVGEAVRMARRQRHEQQVGLGGDGALGALEVGHQHRDHEARAGSSRRPSARRCRRAAAGDAPGRTSRPRSRAGRPPRRRGSIRSCARSAAPSGCSAGRREGRLRGPRPEGELLHVLSPNRTGLCREWSAL